MIAMFVWSVVVVALGRGVVAFDASCDVVSSTAFVQTSVSPHRDSHDELFPIDEPNMITTNNNHNTNNTDNSNTKNDSNNKNSNSNNNNNKKIDHRHSLDMSFLHFASVRVSPHAVDEWIAKLDAVLAEHSFDRYEGNSNEKLVAEEANQYDEWAQNPNISTICETGFNAGHSALRFLASSNAKVYEFDLGAHEYGRVAKTFLDANFPGRLEVSWGDSTKSMPEFIRLRHDVKCDLAIVDGGHSYGVAKADLQNFRRMMSPRHLIAIDDTPCDSSWCVGPTQAWTELKMSGCVEELKQVHMGPGRGFRFGRFSAC
jgi:hypothetical protein